MLTLSLRTRVKHTTTVTNAEGNFALGRALEELKEGELEDARQHFLKAKMSFEKTLESSPREKVRGREQEGKKKKILFIDTTP